MQTGANTAAVHLADIGQIALTVRDLQRAQHFYRDLLGLTFLFDAGSMIFFQCGAIRLMLGLSEVPVVSPGAIVYFKVDDIGATYEALSRHGVLFQQAPHLVAKMPSHDLWMAFLTDPDGNTLALMCEVTGGRI